MINWELPYEQPVCPHCGSTETQLTLQLLGLTRYSCQNCRKSFAAEAATDGAAQPKAKTPDPSPRQA